MTGKAQPRTVEVRTVQVEVPVRYLLWGSPQENQPVFVGFHGYGENAALHLEAMRGIRAVEDGYAVSVQGPSRFYSSRTKQVVASWMTREDRELAMASNRVLVERVVAQVSADSEAGPRPIIWVGFSQGVAMAYRAAKHCQRPGGLIALAGDIPPEVREDDWTNFPPVLLGRGLSDEWYSEEKLTADLDVLNRNGVEHRVERFEGGHEWSESFLACCDDFLETLGTKTSRS